MKRHNDRLIAFDRDFNLWTPGLYDLFRVLLGGYLFIHFVHLIGWSTELFSTAGMLSDPTVSPLFLILPNLFWLSDHTLYAPLITGSAAIASLALVFKYHDKVAAAWILLVLISLFVRNPLIANPALPYLGWMLLAHLFVPRTPAQNEFARWQSPSAVLSAAAVVLALTYSYSGWTKLMSPTWVAGDTLAVVLENPLARDWFLRDIFLSLPNPILQFVTLFILWIELLYAPLYLVRRLRLFLWASMLIVQVGFLFLLNFADLTVVMLLFHLLTFEPRWLKRFKFNEPITLLYDGECGVCHRVVQFTIREDVRGLVHFLPLQDKASERLVTRDLRDSLSTMIVRYADGSTYHHSTAVIHWLRHLGGIWPFMGLLLAAIPKPVRDTGYRLFGAVRHRLRKRPMELCPVLPPELRSRFEQA